MIRLLFLLLFLVFSLSSFAQTAKLIGKITDKDNTPIEGASIEAIFDGQNEYTSTNQFGKFSISVPANKKIQLLITHLSFSPVSKSVRLSNNEEKEINFQLSGNYRQLGTVEITGEKESVKRDAVNIDKKHLEQQLTNENVEAILFSEPSVSSNNEFSSQYSVRGGNFDENLVYVNDIEVYRPFLVRAGRQEGLSFVNPDMVENIEFSAGGFGAKYGDKLSSVLDIKYRNPDSLRGSFSASILGARFHLENRSKNEKFSYILGTRFRSNAYLLGSLDTDGEYQPRFMDVQTYMNYEVNSRWKLSFLGNVSDNQFNMSPVSRSTNFGQFQQAFNLQVFFEGEEKDAFQTYFGAFTSSYLANENTSLKFIVSGFKTYESETFDIIGQYRLSDLETNFGEEEFGESTFTIGSGGLLDHSRNFLEASVVNVAHRGTWSKKANTIYWGASAQQEVIDDEISEWKMLDSSGYSQPQNTNSLVDLDYILRTNINLSSLRYKAFLQWDHEFNGGKTLLSSGVRTNYWDLNNQLIWSPRVSLSHNPTLTNDTNLLSLRFATGLYQQPPFYRELRNLQGVLNPELRAQSSIHFISGLDYHFQLWNKPFKWSLEAYYKHLYNLVPYEVDNVRIRYYAENSSTGYAAGVESKVYGEFIKGMDSWFSIGVMKTEEDIENDFYYLYLTDAGDTVVNTQGSMIVDSIYQNPGLIPRPTDQRLNFGIFFRDQMPGLPAFTVHLNLLYGSRLPFGAPNTPKGLHVFRMSPYRRVDMGFSYQVVKDGKYYKSDQLRDIPSQSVMSHFNTFHIKLEIFNLLAIQNTISYFWVDDINNNSYAVPNYLTNRLINLKLIGKF